MPALKMKSKPNTSYLREGSNLHVCHSSTTISKGSSNQAKTCQQAIVQDNCKASANLETTDECKCIRPTEVFDHQDSCSKETDQISCLPLASSTIACIEKVPQQMSCSSFLETNFSRFFEPDETENKSRRDSRKAVDSKHDELPHLVADDGVDGCCSPNDYQSCSFSDYDISDLTFDESMDFSDLIASTSPDYDHINFESTFGSEDRCMMFPFTERGLDADSNICDRVNEEDFTSLCFTYQQLIQFDQEVELNSQTDDAVIEEWLDPHFFIMMPDLSEVVSSICPLPLPKEMEKKAVTLVLDLDETLIHSTTDYCDNADFSFLVYFNTKENTVYVKQRPHLRMFLERVAQMFKIIIFTASQSIYAEKILDILDPDKKLISQHLFRESCFFSEESYVKDLTILDVDLAKVAIIDNTPQVYRLQVNNGIPIKSWFDDPDDNELITLLPFLETLVNAEDVRPIISKEFNNK